MKENRLDNITDLIKERIGGIVGEAHKQFKGTNPYRQEKVSTDEQLSHYDTMTPYLETSLRQSFGNQVVDNYKVKMEQIKIRRGQSVSTL